MPNIKPFKLLKPKDMNKAFVELFEAAYKVRQSFIKNGTAIDQRKQNAKLDALLNTYIMDDTLKLKI